jgi:hypothetical protein
VRSAVKAVGPLALILREQAGHFRETRFWQTERGAPEVDFTVGQAE